MLKRLRLRLTALIVLMTGAVFAILMALMAVNGERQYIQMNELLFQDRLTAIVSRLQTEESIENGWLAETESAQRSILALESNGAPLQFRGAWKPRTDRERLIALARKRAQAAGLDYRVPPLDITKTTHVFFRLEGEAGEPYRCTVALIPAARGWFSLTLLDDISAETLHLRRQRRFYLCLSLAAFTVLCLLGWLFTGRALRPTQAGMESQRRFVAAASHELKSPLAVIESTASAIRAAPERMDELTAGIQGECGRLGRLVGDLLLLANTDTPGFQVALEAVSMEAVLMDVAEQYRPVAARSGFSLELELPDDLLPPILGDFQRLEQMFAILLDNAISHSGVPGPLLVRAYVAARHLTVEVVDHGDGIPEEMYAQVFERFSRMDKARTGKNHFGLGLPIVKELARLHRGSVTLTQTPGGGCTFRLCFPAPKQ